MAEAKRLTLEELRAKTAKAIKDATTFEKSPTFDMPVGSEVLFRVKRVIEGNFEAPMVITDDLRTMNGEKKFVTGTLKGYTQDRKEAPRIPVEVEAGKDVRIPSFVVRRAKAKGLEFHPRQVYWSKFIEEKKVERGTFKVTAIDLVGTDFPTE